MGKLMKTIYVRVVRSRTRELPVEVSDSLFAAIQKITKDYEYGSMPKKEKQELEKIISTLTNNTDDPDIIYKKAKQVLVETTFGFSTTKLEV